MPPTKRTRTSGATQKTLSFTNSKISKSTSKESKPVLRPKAEIEIKSEINIKLEEDSGHVSSLPAITQQAKVEVRNLGGEEEKALKVTDAQIKKYWCECERQRRSPRVHQEELGVEEKVLRLWDMSSQYGPCIGVARMKRWVRANKLGLNPPIEVLAVLLKEEEKGHAGIERAYVDELFSSKLGVVEP